MTTVGPFGTVRTAGVASGASGKSRAGLTWEEGGVVDCEDADMAHARTRADAKREGANLIPPLRVNHAAGWLPGTCGATEANVRSRGGCWSPTHSPKARMDGAPGCLSPTHSPKARMDGAPGCLSPTHSPKARLDGAHGCLLARAFLFRRKGVQLAIDDLPIDKLYVCSWPRNLTFCLEPWTC